METTVITSTNLFGQAAEVKKATKANKSYEEVTLSEDDFPGISERLTDLQETRDDLADKKGKEAMLAGEIKAIAKEQFIRLFNLTGTNPSTFILRGEHGGAFMVQTMDKYITIDATRAKQLQEKYGKDIVTTDTAFLFNPAILNKPGNMEKISNALTNSDLTDDEKTAIIQTKVSQTISKGYIDKLGSGEHSVGDTFDDVKPIIALKNHK